jgi:inhibitor of KinA sporulation pathway (predicted exonuclease)
MEIEQIIFFDLEMYCNVYHVPFEDQETIRIGAVKYDVKTGNKTYFDSYVKPRRKRWIPKYCTHLTGIEQKHIDTAPRFDRAMCNFLRWAKLDKPTKLYCWGESDIPRLKIDMQNARMSLELLKGVEPEDYQKQFSELYSCPQVSVTNGVQMFGKRFEGTIHNPVDDANNALHIYLSTEHRLHPDAFIHLHYFYLLNREEKRSYCVWEEAIALSEDTSKRSELITKSIQVWADRLYREHAEKKHASIEWLASMKRLTLEQIDRIIELKIFTVGDDSTLDGMMEELKKFAAKMQRYIAKCRKARTSIAFRVHPIAQLQKNMTEINTEHERTLVAI